MNIIKDVSHELRRLQQDPKALKKFGITIACALAVLGILVALVGKHSERAFWLGTVAALFLLLGLLAPSILKPFHKFWMGLAFVLGWFVSRLILTLLFYLVITPIALIMRLSGKDLLNQKFDKNGASYWIRRNPEEESLERYEKLF